MEKEKEEKRKERAQTLSGWLRAKGPNSPLHGPSGQSPPGQNWAKEKNKMGLPLARPMATSFSSAQPLLAQPAATSSPVSLKLIDTSGFS